MPLRTPSDAISRDTHRQVRQALRVLISHWLFNEPRVREQIDVAKRSTGLRGDEKFGRVADQEHQSASRHLAVIAHMGALWGGKIRQAIVQQFPTVERDIIQAQLENTSTFQLRLPLYQRAFQAGDQSVRICDPVANRTYDRDENLEKTFSQLSGAFRPFVERRERLQDHFLQPPTLREHFALATIRDRPRLNPDQLRGATALASRRIAAQEDAGTPFGLEARLRISADIFRRAETFHLR
jgi:hypothetical protein